MEFLLAPGAKKRAKFSHHWFNSADFCSSVDVCVSAKMLNHLRRFRNKFNFSNDFLVFSLNVSLLCSTTAWGIFVCIVVSSVKVYLLFSAFIAAGVRMKFVMSVCCRKSAEVEKKGLNEPFTHLCFHRFPCETLFTFSWKLFGNVLIWCIVCARQVVVEDKKLSDIPRVWTFPEQFSCTER